ncbi:RNA polymerase-binding protein DksA [Methylococcus sp. BF19-07]
MPEGDYMNASQTAFFRHYLGALRAELLERALSARTVLEAGDGLSDPNDRATLEEEHLIERRRLDRERKYLKKIDAALARIGEGTYGYCEETGEPIGLRRLLARPTTTLCLEAQIRHERAERQGNPS